MEIMVNIHSTNEKNWFNKTMTQNNRSLHAFWGCNGASIVSCGLPSANTNTAIQMKMGFICKPHALQDC
jgi:hypothetical protein